MTNKATKALVTAGAAGALLFSGVVGNRLADTTPPEVKPCDVSSQLLTSKECFAAGIIRNVSLGNLQGSGQFCTWKKANPGEWLRLKNYSETQGLPDKVITWFGAHIQNDIEAYFAAGGDVFIIKPNIAKNICHTPLPAPVIGSVTPGQNSATVTVDTTPSG